MKWVTISQWVDLETGETLTKDIVDKHYYIIRNTKKITHDNTHSITRRIIYECRKRPQQGTIF